MTVKPSPARPLTAYKVLTFDCYGTLIDWESGIWDAGQPLLAHNQCESVTRQDFLAGFAEAETAEEAASPTLPYPDLLERVHVRLAARFDLTTNTGLDRDFGGSVPHWPGFPDTADALRRLSRHYKLAILSNVDRAGFAASNRKLGVAFDAVYTAQDVGSYKPNPQNFDYLLHHLPRDLDLAAADILHTAQSLHHDLVEAPAHGLATAWIDRQRLSEGGAWGATATIKKMPEVDFLYFSLAEMADAVDAAAK